MNKTTKRLIISVIAGAILGVFCIIGASVRFGADVVPSLLFALWFNRVVMGIAIGAPWGEVSLIKTLGRGALLGLIVSFAYFSSTGFSDIVSFIAGILYGIIIEYVAFMAAKRFAKNKQN